MIATLTYDALGRRVTKCVQNSGDWNATYRYYYDGDRVVEERNSSNKTLRQYVWGTQYVDELVQTSINDDPSDGNEQVCETKYWALQDANYNVLGIVDSSGDLKERYEYTPYGQRTVYKSAGSADTTCRSPILDTQPVTISSVAQAYGICDVGHQGTFFEKEFRKNYVRTRYWDPVLGRWISPDPFRYIDGNSYFEGLRSNPLSWLDPDGQEGLGWFGLKLIHWVYPNRVTAELIEDAEAIDGAPGRVVKGVAVTVMKIGAEAGWQGYGHLQEGRYSHLPLVLVQAQLDVVAQPVVDDFVAEGLPKVKGAWDIGAYDLAYWQLQAEVVKRNPISGCFTRVIERVIESGRVTRKDKEELADTAFGIALMMAGAKRGGEPPSPEQPSPIPGASMAPEGAVPARPVPPRIYRSGRYNESAAKDIRVDADGVSFRDSISNPFPKPENLPMRPGPYIIVDPSKLPPGTVIPDGVPPGHVTVTATLKEIVEGMVGHGSLPKTK